VKFRFEAVPRATVHTPFEPSGSNYLIWRTGGSGLVMSRLFSFRPGMTELDHFPMGYTSLWVMLRLGLWIDGERVVSWPQDKGVQLTERQGGFYVFDADQEPSHWRHPGGKAIYGYSSEAEATEWCREQATQGRPLMLAQLLEDVGWH